MSIPEYASTQPLDDGASPEIFGALGLTRMHPRASERRSALASASRLLVENLGAVPTTLQSCGASDTDRTHLTVVSTRCLGRSAFGDCCGLVADSPVVGEVSRDRRVLSDQLRLFHVGSEGPGYDMAGIMRVLLGRCEPGMAVDAY